MVNLLTAFSILPSSSAKPCSSCQLWTSFAERISTQFSRMLLFSDSTCSVQNLKTAVRTASAPENAFKTKESLQCVWKGMQSEARPDSSHEAERRHVGAQRDKDFLRVSSEPLALVLFGRVGTELSGCHTLAGQIYFPPARCGSSTHRAEVGGGKATGRPPRSRCPGRPAAGFPWLFTIHPPSPFLQEMTSFYESLVTCGAPRCNAPSL